MSKFMHKLLGLGLLLSLAAGCAAKKELKPVPGSEAFAPDARRNAQAAQYEKELKQWNERLTALKMVALETPGDAHFKTRTKAIDDIEGQMKEASIYIRKLRDATNEKEETVARDQVLGDLTTIQKIFRQMEAE